MVSLHDGHLNLAQSGHYNFAVTQYVRIIYLMLNGNELQDVLSQYSRSALSLDDDFLLAWEIPPRWRGIWRD